MTATTSEILESAIEIGATQVRFDCLKGEYAAMIRVGNRRAHGRGVNIASALINAGAEAEKMMRVRGRA